jgi:predicted outer membrane protein
VIKDIEQHCQQNAAAELQKHQGADFDQAYLGMMVIAHGKMLSTLEAVKSKASPSLQQVIAQAEDSTRQHHEMANDLIKRIGSEGSAARSASRPGQPNQNQENRNQ